MRSFVRFHRTVILLVLIHGAFHICAHGQPNATGQTASNAALPPLPEMWTKLQAKLDSATVRPGDAVRAQVSQGWVYGTCGVQGGSTLAGEVEAVTAWTDAARASQVSISFTATCGNGEKKRLILIAVYYPIDDPKSQMDLYSSIPAGIGHGASGRQSTDLSALPTPGAGDVAPFPVAKIGEVKRINHLSLALAKGVSGSSVLASTDKRFRLLRGTRLVLLPVPEGN
jgi:hypothetical protein